MKSEMRIRRRGYLSSKDFEEYLSLVRSIGRYDPDSKEWIVDEDKLARLSIEEVERVTRRLAKYAEVNIQEILSLARRSLPEVETVTLDMNRSLKFKHERVKKALTFLGRDIIEVFNGKVILKSLKYLPVLKERLRAKGIELVYDPSILQVEVYRSNGRLIVKPRVWDREILNDLKQACTLSYFVEKPILGPDREYMGSELIERKIRAYSFSREERSIITHVGLLNEIVNTLKSNGLRVILKIDERPKLNLTLKPLLKLMPHQEEAYRLWLREKRGTIAIFTRGGKSFIALKAIADLNLPSIIFVPTKEVLETWLEYISKYLGVPKGVIGVFGGGTLRLSGITVAIYNSAVRHLSKLIGKFELAIFDECHHVPAATFKEVALRIDSLYRMALSATPRRRDGNEKLLFKLSGALVYSLGYEDLLRLKLVAPIETYEVIFAEGKDDKLEKLLAVLEKYEKSKTIIYTQYLKTAREVYEKLITKGFRPVIITGKSSSGERHLAFRSFSEGRNRIMVTTTVLDEGITVPDAEVAIIYEGSGEGRQLIQRIGRVLGYEPGKTAKVFEIVDVTDPKERYAFSRRKWVRELYMTPDLPKYVKREKRGLNIEGTFQRRIDTF